jgi:hypothetical protein
MNRVPTFSLASGTQSSARRTGTLTDVRGSVFIVLLRRILIPGILGFRRPLLPAKGAPCRRRRPWLRTSRPQKMKGQCLAQRALQCQASVGRFRVWSSHRFVEARVPPSGVKHRPLSSLTSGSNEACRARRSEDDGPSKPPATTHRSSGLNATDQIRLCCSGNPRATAPFRNPRRALRRGGNRWRLCRRRARTGRSRASGRPELVERALRGEIPEREPVGDAVEDGRRRPCKPLTASIRLSGEKESDMVRSRSSKRRAERTCASRARSAFGNHDESPVVEMPAGRSSLLGAPFLESAPRRDIPN